MNDDRARFYAYYDFEGSKHIVLIAPGQYGEGIGYKYDNIAYVLTQDEAYGLMESINQALLHSEGK